MYILSNITLAALGLSASWKQKAMFAFIIGILLHSVPVYGVYLLGGGAAFSYIALLFFVTPNPVYGFIYYFAAQKIFKFSPVRSLKLISYIYLFWIATKSLSRIIGATLFIQNEANYNFLKDALQQITYFIIFFIIYQIVISIIKRGHVSFNFVDNMFFNKRKEFSLFFLKASFAFAVRFTLPLILEEQALAYTLALVILILFIVINIGWDAITYHRQTISNHEVHISALFNGMEELRGIKHDFNNILHTYSGYLELKEYERLEKYHASLVSHSSQAGSTMELAQKMQENPAVVTLFINKLEYAESMNVNLRVSLKCELGNLYIDNMDISRVLACLLDNAIEAAGDSEQRKVYITMESKPSGSKLIIITNSTASAVDPNMILNSGTTKPGHDGIGLSIVRKILAKHGNSTFQMKYCDRELSAYIELKEEAL
jgi:two-component system sensor histidine kinase AgrC